MQPLRPCDLEGLSVSEVLVVGGEALRSFCQAQAKNHSSGGPWGSIARPHRLPQKTRCFLKNKSSQATGPSHSLRNAEVSRAARNELGLSDPPRRKVGDTEKLSILKEKGVGLWSGV